MAREELGKSEALVTPLYQSAVYTLPDLDVLDEIMNGEKPGYIYARDGHPNARELAEECALLEGGTWGLITGSGMAAISAILLTALKQGDSVVASNRLYGKTTQLLQSELSRFGITTTFVDLTNLAEVAQALQRGPKLLFVETLSNPLLRVADLDALVELCEEQHCLLIVDNTFATPALVKPLDLGADIVMESLTKMIGGHSDVTLGLLCGQGDMHTALTPVISAWGLSSNPFDCWLASRGLATLHLRMRQACANALELAHWLAEQSAVKQVVYPGLPEHPDHELAKKLLKDGFGNMLCFELVDGREGVNHFLHRCKEIPFSPSLGHTLTTCSHPGTTSHRYVSPAERRRQGISDGLVRLSVGIEDIELIKEKMTRGVR